MQEFLEQLRKLGPDQSGIRETAVAAAEIIDRSLNMVEPIIVRAQQDQLRHFLTLVENEISSGGSLERLRDKIRRSPLFNQANASSFKQSR